MAHAHFKTDLEINFSAISSWFYSRSNHTVGLTGDAAALSAFFSGDDRSDCVAEVASSFAVAPSDTAASLSSTGSFTNPVREYPTPLRGGGAKEKYKEAIIPTRMGTLLTIVEGRLG